MTTITGPDGAEIEFPDETSEAEMNAAMAQAYPQPQGGIMGALKGASRALEANIPGVDRMVAAAKGGDYAQNLAKEEATNTQFAKDNPWTNTAGGLAALSAGSGAFALDVPFGLSGMAGRVASSAAPWAVGGGLQGALSSPDLTNIPDTAKRAGLNAGISGTIGAAVPLAGAGIAKAISPLLAAPERQAMVEGLQQAGVTPTAGQATGNRFVQGLEGPSEGGWTKALMDQGGIPATNATQPSLLAAKTAIEGKLTDAASRNTLIPDEQLAKDLAGAPGEFNKLISPSPEVANVTDRLMAKMSQPISGEEYASLRSQLTNQAFAIKKTNPIDAQAYRSMRDALDDGMERSIEANNPADLGAFREARRSYGNFQDISKAASKLTGENAVQGTIPPSRMQAVLSSGNKAPAYAAGQGDLAQLTRQGVGIMQPQEAAINPLARALMSHTMGGYAGAALGHLPGIGALVRTRPVQSFLANRVMAGAGPRSGADLAALAAGLSGRQLLMPQGNTQR
jgi:hypothetical protein